MLMSISKIYRDTMRRSKPTELAGVYESRSILNNIMDDSERVENEC